MDLKFLHDHHLKKHPILCNAIHWYLYILINSESFRNAFRSRSSLIMYSHLPFLISGNFSHPFWCSRSDSPANCTVKRFVKIVRLHRTNANNRITFHTSIWAIIFVLSTYLLLQFWCWILCSVYFNVNLLPCKSYIKSWYGPINSINAVMGYGKYLYKYTAFKVGCVVTCPFGRKI